MVDHLANVGLITIIFSDLNPVYLLSHREKQPKE